MPSPLTPEELERIEREAGQHGIVDEEDALALVAEVRRLTSELAATEFGRQSAMAGVERLRAELAEARRDASEQALLAEERLAHAHATQAELEEAERDRNRLHELLPLEFRAGRWAHGDGDDDPAAVITYSTTPSPETGHVGWVWWARGKTGEASSLREAKRMAVGKLRGEHRDGGE